MISIALSSQPSGLVSHSEGSEVPTHDLQNKLVFGTSWIS
jgi:hypothetical protein